MRLFKRITALALAAVTAGALGLSAAAEVKETAAEPIELEVHCPTNEDPEFPFCLDINVMPGSIQYIDLDEPIYGFERVLDEEALDFDVSFSLKDEYKSFDSYDFQVFNSDYSEQLVSKSLENYEILTMNELSLGTEYKIGITLQSDVLTSDYVGQFTIHAELNSSLTVDLFYQNASNAGDLSLYTSTLTYEESEDNESEVRANYVGNGAIMEGSLSSYSDVDRFYFYSTQGDTNGAANLDISLSVPKGSMIDVDIYSEDGKYRKQTLNSINSSLYVRMTNIAPDTKFYVKLSHRLGTIGGTYRLIINRTVGVTWFGQYVSRIGGTGDFWNSYRLDTLKINGKSFFDNDSTNHWMMEGCAIASTAMILRNIGATMDGYDFRTDFSGYMYADPFTVMLANCELDGTTMNPNTTSLYTNGSPIYMILDNICERFSFSGKTISYNTVSLTEAALKKAVKENGYVLVRLSNNGFEHFMVITGFTDGASFAERVLVCDPAAYSYATGVGVDRLGVPLSETTSGYNKMEVKNIVSARYLTIAG